MSSDFTHGWSSSSYVFRVEVDGRLDHEYTFSINGVPFNKMQRKEDVVRRKSSSDNYDQGSREVDGANNNNQRNQKAPVAKNTSYGQTTVAAKIAAAPDRRFSNDAPNSDPNRGFFQSPDVIKKDNFDPFDSNEMSDPFGEDSFGEKNIAVAKSKTSAQRNAPPAQPVTSLFDSMNDDVAPINSISFGNSTAPSAAFDPFGSSADPFNSPPPRRASDFSKDFAGMSFTAAPVPHSVPVETFNKVESAPFSADNFFEEESIPIVTRNVAPEVWSAPKNLVNLDFNAPPPSQSTNAFSGRSPSLNLLLNGSSTRVQGATGMNSQMSKVSTNSGSSTPQAIMNGPQGMNGGQMGMNGPQGMNGGQMGMNGPQGMNGGQMGMNNGAMGSGINRTIVGGLGGGMPVQGSGMMQHQSMGSSSGMMSVMNGQQSQGVQHLQQQQPNGRMMMGSRGNSSGTGMIDLPSGSSIGPGSSLGMQSSGSSNGMQGMTQGGSAFSMSGNSVNIASTSGATSSLTGGSLARGVPSLNAPKSSLDTINWKM